MIRTNSSGWMIWVHVGHPRYDGAQLSPERIKKSVVLHYAGFCDICVAWIFSRPLIGSYINQAEFWFGLITFFGGPVSFFSYKPLRINCPGWFDYCGKQLCIFRAKWRWNASAFSERSEPYLVARFCQPLLVLKK